MPNLEGHRIVKTSSKLLVSNTITLRSTSSLKLVRFGTTRLRELITKTSNDKTRKALHATGFMTPIREKSSTRRHDDLRSTVIPIFGFLVDR